MYTYQIYNKYIVLYLQIIVLCTATLEGYASF
jgi:hypothetical protein